MEWFHHRLQPGVHFIPLAFDLSDLVTRTKTVLLEAGHDSRRLQHMAAAARDTVAQHVHVMAQLDSFMWSVLQVKRLVAWPTPPRDSWAGSGWQLVKLKSSRHWISYGMPKPVREDIMREFSHQFEEVFMEQLLASMWLYRDFPDPLELWVNYADLPAVCNNKVPFLQHTPPFIVPAATTLTNTSQGSRSSGATRGWLALDQAPSPIPDSYLARVLTNKRVRLALMAPAYPWLDIGITLWNEPVLHLTNTYMAKGKVDLETWGRYVASLSIDGHGSPWRLAQQLLGGAPVLKVESPLKMRPSTRQLRGNSE
ncbi:uncharacterized protein HaLaN_08647 [Haematococcus lacustris]|uniref:Uncharacterized protein n=1 Tax=Haematococcus lacustris TaxID=44745 RepID=A0A699YZN9_HAELA|nr:uncharacterized protein HaLaN_08647 [Haematococcus lacustris]